MLGTSEKDLGGDVLFARSSTAFILSSPCEMWPGVVEGSVWDGYFLFSTNGFRKVPSAKNPQKSERNRVRFSKRVREKALWAKLCREG